MLSVNSMRFEMCKPRLCVYGDFYRDMCKVKSHRLYTLHFTFLGIDYAFTNKPLIRKNCDLLMCDGEGENAIMATINRV